MPDASDLVERAGELGVRITVASVVIVAFAVLARVTSPLVRRLLNRRGRPSRTRVFGALYRLVVVLIGSLFALTLAFPSVRVADVLAIFGIVSVAAGFAFKDTFENLLAGVLLLLRDPFKSGDQVTIAGREGTVAGVTVRETLLRGHDGHRYFIPNAKVMTDVIDVATHEPLLRQSFTIRIAAAADFGVVRRSIRDSLAELDIIATEPRPEVVLVDIVDGDVDVECRFWSGSRRSDVTRARDAAIAASLGALISDDVPLPLEEVLVHLPERDASSAEPPSRGRS